MHADKNMNPKGNQKVVETNSQMDDAITKVRSIQDLTIAQIDKIAECVAKVLKDKNIKTNQIRNVYGYISKVRNYYNSKPGSNEEVKNMLVFLKPKLAYIAGRIVQVKNSGMDKFYRAAIDSVVEAKNSEHQKKALDNFFKLAEAIVAYHRYYAG